MAGEQAFCSLLTVRLDNQFAVNLCHVDEKLYVQHKIDVDEMHCELLTVSILWEYLKSSKYFRQ